MMAKGTYQSIMLATKDLDGVFAKLESSGAEIMQEPIDQQWGSRDCAVRDPSGNTVRIQQLS
nr:VOC family protein [Sporichthya sp.]